MAEEKGYDPKTGPSHLEVTKEDLRTEATTIKIGRYRLSVLLVALCLIIITVLVTPAIFAIRLRDPSPIDVVVVVSIGVFAALLFFSALDAISILTFRADWIRKAIYRLAIFTILSSLAGGVADQFVGSKYPYEGRWELTIRRQESKEFLADHTLLLTYSKPAKVYWGYSDARFVGTEKHSGAVWVEVARFSPVDGSISFRLILRDGSALPIAQKLDVGTDKLLLKTAAAESEEFEVRMARSR